MIMTILASFRELLWLEVQLRRRGFSRAYHAVRSLGIRRLSQIENYSEVCRAVDIACVLYLKEVPCLQRSAAVVRLLRKRGVHAELVIGVQQWPFRAHAWAEIGGQVVNDKPHVIGDFVVIDRC
jgi:hypothetical protein